MEPSKEAIAVRISRLNRQILGKATAVSSKFSKKTIDREALLDALTVLYDECNDDPVKKSDDLVRAFVDKYRSTLAELRRIRVCISDFEILQTIGRGHFGDVHLVREKETCDVYALKCVRKELARRRAAGAAEDEREVLATAAGPWAPKLQYAFQDNNNLYLVMELCPGGDLAGLLSRRHNPLCERDAAFYVAEVAHALKALHQLGFVHRDVKPHNILIDRCGHVKLGDFGSCARLANGVSTIAVGTADYVAPELLAAADCAQRHAVCAECCRGIDNTALSACDYWSLGVVAFELVTLRRPFSTGDDDSIPSILSNIQKYERSPDAEPPFEAPPNGPSSSWRSLVAGLLRVTPSRRYNYLDTLQHAALQHLSVHSIRDQAPPWVPLVRGPEDASHFSPPPREAPPVSAAPFRARPPFAGQLPFIGYSFVAHDDNDDSAGTTGFNASHDCTAIDLATFKSSEKLAAMRGREIASLQSKLAAAEASASEAASRVRRAADAEAERTRAKLQAEITALSLQNKRLERQIEIEKEERMALERTNQELVSSASDRTNAELRAAHAHKEELARERDNLRDGVARLEARVSEMQNECARAVAAADAARAQHKHYKDILEQAQELRHRTLTELNVRAIDSVAKERAIRRQTLSGGEAETREAGARAAAAEASAARELRARQHAEKQLAIAEADARELRRELEDVRRELATAQESLGEKHRVASASTDQLKETQMQLTQERIRASSLAAQVQELQRSIQEAAAREAALEEQCARTEARFNERLDAAEARAAAALHEDARHREKVNTLEQLVRQLEREVTALENKTCANCEARDSETPQDSPRKHAHSDTESVGDAAHAHSPVLREQLERAEAQLQARMEEIAALRQEARSANLARWRKEREFNELQLEAKATARDLKRAEERLTTALEARRAAERKVTEVQAELLALKPQYEQATKDAERAKQQLAELQKRHETAQAEVDRSRNDIRKLKSELQYSEKRRIHAEEQEEMSSRERGQLRDENVELRSHNTELAQVRHIPITTVYQYSEERRLHAEEQEEMSSRERGQLRDENVELRSHNTELAQVRHIPITTVYQYSEERRLHAEEQEEMSSRERGQLRDENVELRSHNTELAQVRHIPITTVYQYSEERRLHAEEQEEMSSRERGQLRDENVELRSHNTELAQVRHIPITTVYQYSEERRLHAEEQEEMSSRERGQLRDENVELRSHNTELAQVRHIPITTVYQYSEERRLHAEEQEEMSSRERGQLRDENVELRSHNTELAQNNKALQEACSLLEGQLIDLEKLSDLNDVKSKDLECEVHRLRSDLAQVQQKLGGAQSACAERSAAAALAAQNLSEAQDKAQQAAQQVQLLQDRVERSESRIATLEARCAQLESAEASTTAALGSAARRVHDLQEECAALRTAAHDHHAQALQLQAALDEAQEQLESSRETAEAATAWWRTRETKADATLRQQAKLIDFLQAKVEEAGRKKCSLGDKLFGRSGRRNNVSPPLRRANRELREEVDRLRAKLAASKSFNESDFPPTPRRDKKLTNGTVKSIDTPDCARTTTTSSRATTEHSDSFLQIVWRDGSKERMSARLSDGVLLLKSGDRELRARLTSPDASGLPFNEANRAFAIKILNPDARGAAASAVCGDMATRSHWLGVLTVAPLGAGYTPQSLVALTNKPRAAAYVGDNAVAVGCEDGLHSLRGSVRLTLPSPQSPRDSAVSCVTVAGGRVLLARGGSLLHGSSGALASALRRADSLRPAVDVQKVALPDRQLPHYVTAMTGGNADGSCAVGLGRRVVVLRWDAAAARYNTARALTVDKPPPSLLLTPTALYIAGEKPLRVSLPSGPLEAFAKDDPTVAAAARKRSSPRAILLISSNPIEILICYTECGVFVDENGRRTRNEDPNWSASVHEFAFVKPFLYAIGEDRVTIVHISDEAYKAAPCTCDTNSLASSGSEACIPEIFNLKLLEPALLGTCPEGVIVSTKLDDGYQVSVVNGLAAFRSIGTSLESLNTVSDKGSTPDLARSLSDSGQSVNDFRRSMTELAPHDSSQETINGATGFLADIKKRAKQLRAKNQKQHQMNADDVIKEILTTEIGLKRSFIGRKSPARTSEFDSDSESPSDTEQSSEDSQTAEDVCAEMFTRQVRFQ